MKLPLWQKERRIMTTYLRLPVPPMTQVRPLVQGLRREIGDALERTDRSWNQALDSIPTLIWQDDKSVHVELELPGVSEDAIEATIHRDLLTVSANWPQPEKRSELHNSRPRRDRLTQTIRLPETVRGTEVEAQLRLGVLHLRLPKTPEAQPRQVQIRTH